LIDIYKKIAIRARLIIFLYLFMMSTKSYRKVMLIKECKKNGRDNVDFIIVN